LAKSLFQEQMSLERLVSTIITEAKELLKCERCTVYLLELKMYDQVSKHHLNLPKMFKVDNILNYKLMNPNSH
jgi:hypothetical protein